MTSSQISQLLETLAQRHFEKNVPITRHTLSVIWAEVSLSSFPQAIKYRHMSRINALHSLSQAKQSVA